VIGALAGGIANEFNNMLTPILGFAGLALEESSAGSREEKRLQHILTAANRAQKLAEQLLAFSRQSEPRRVPVQMRSVVKEALEFLRPTLPRTIDIRSRVDVEHDIVMADPDQLLQVLINLCTDAHHSMPDGGTLEVALAEVDSAASLADRSRLHDDEYLRLTVRDTGRGMDPETKERVLKPFFGGKEGARENQPMTGLGLAVTYGIVVSHGGDLAVDSEPGKGTTVHVYLPLADRDL
jgi:signal transduction histidine kinase